MDCDGPRAPPEGGGPRGARCFAAASLRATWRASFCSAVLVSFLFFFSIFFINVLLVTATDIMAKQVPLGDVALLVLYSLPQIIHLAFPFATLLGALMALGRLRADRELIALQASGIRLLRGNGAGDAPRGGVFGALVRHQRRVAAGRHHRVQPHLSAHPLQ